MRERIIEQHLRRRIEAMGGQCYKLHAIHQQGLPDRLVLLPDGRVFFVELKSPGKKPTRIQEIVHARLRILKQVVMVLDSKEAVDGFIESL
jgi:hypothetical protein